MCEFIATADDTAFDVHAIAVWESEGGSAQPQTLPIETSKAWTEQPRTRHRHDDDSDKNLMKLIHEPDVAGRDHDADDQPDEANGVGGHVAEQRQLSSLFAVP